MILPFSEGSEEASSFWRISAISWFESPAGIRSGQVAFSDAQLGFRSRQVPFSGRQVAIRGRRSGQVMGWRHERCCSGAEPKSAIAFRACSGEGAAVWRGMPCLAPAQAKP